MEFFYEGKVCKKNTGKFLREFRVYKENDTLVWELTQGKQALFDMCDFELLLPYHLRAQKDSQTYYAVVNESNTVVIGTHRLIIGCPDTHITVDHKNRNGLDNRRCNLRLATAEQQILNKIRNGKPAGGDFSCEYRGVVQRGDNFRYRVRGSVLGKQYNLGHFSCPVIAAEAWDEFLYESFKSHNPLKGMCLNGVCGEPSVNFINFNFPERLGL